MTLFYALHACQIIAANNFFFVTQAPKHPMLIKPFSLPTFIKIQKASACFVCVWIPKQKAMACEKHCPKSESQDMLLNWQTFLIACITYLPSRNFIILFPGSPGETVALWVPHGDH